MRYEEARSLVTECGYRMSRICWNGEAYIYMQNGEIVYRRISTIGDLSLTTAYPYIPSYSDINSDDWIEFNGPYAN